MKKSQKLKQPTAHPTFTPALLQEIGRIVVTAANSKHLLIDTAGFGLAGAEMLENIGLRVQRVRKLDKLHWTHC